jgi:hypothetical protein
MGFLLRLPLLLIEHLLRRLFGGGAQDTYAPAAPPSAAAPAAEPFVGETGAPPPPTADEALDRRAARDATASPGSVTPLRPIAESLNGHIDTEPTVVESFGPADDVGDVGGTITVDEPWDGYADQPASAIVTRLRDADLATKAVVALYERGHKNRRTVLKATG